MTDRRDGETATDPLAALTELGVALWLDDLSRDRLATGNLAELVRDKHIVGVTTNPTIFDKAISGSDLYDDQVRDLARRNVSVGEALRMITTHDVRAACDLLAPVHNATDGLDGRVSIEVAPELAHDTARTIAEARELWWLVDRPNVFIKVPATVEGLPAISQCLSEGISVNVTLIFGLERYAAVMGAFFEGMERAQKAGHDLSRLASVASFFVSRVDTEVDQRLDKIGTKEAKAVRGKAAIANARLAYELHEQHFDSARWRSLAAAGARPQRPLWASTGVKDPSYDDTRYVVDLAVANVVSTMPEGTIHAIADHGRSRGDEVHGSYEDARAAFADLAAAGVDFDDVVAVLEDEGVEKFASSWSDLLRSVDGELKRLGREVA
jgi:transaldolase